MDLIARCKNQDIRAQRQFYNMYYKMVYNSCCRILSDRMDAEDCMQETFIKAFSKIRTINDAPPEAWLRRIAINTALDKLKQDRVKWVEIDEKDHFYADEQDDENEDIIWKVDQVKKTIGELPEYYRLILTLHLFEGYDHEEISDILKLKVTTVRSQYMRAKQKLVEIVKKEKILCV